MSINYSFGLTNLLSQDLTSIALTQLPHAQALYNADGSLNWDNGLYQNPLAHTKRPFDSKTNSLISNLMLSYELLPGLSLKSNFGYTNVLYKATYKLPVSSYWSGATGTVNTSRFGNNTFNSWNIEPQLNWNKSIGKSEINILIGSTFQDQTAETNSQTATGFSSESLMDNLGAVPAANVTSSSDYSKYRYNGIFGRIAYNFEKKYIINLTGRRDGSSRFGRDRQFGNFGAIGAAWIFSDEKLIAQHFGFLSYGKLRGSYGTNGSDQIPNYGYLDTYAAFSQYQGITGLLPQRLENPDFSWEVNKKMELALELGFLNNRISLNTAYYRNRSSNQLVGLPLAPTAGFPDIQYNLDATVENSGVEFEINSVNVKSNAFTWKTSGNISFAKNKLVKYENIEGSVYANTYIVGQPLNIVRSYTSLGVNAQTGLYEVEDVDKNNSYNINDRTNIGFISPKFYGGISNNLTYSGFQLDFLFQFVKQNGRNYLVNYPMPGQMSIQPIQVMDRWQNPGDVKSIQRFSQGSSTVFTRAKESNLRISDASFVRLKNVSISYDIPRIIINKLKIRGSRFFIQGQNLLTITRYKGLDPESQGLTLPPLRIWTAGIQLTL